ncbi:Tat pathway signal protein [Streptomyces sp. NBC_01622]|uniref:subtype B tannase n=1 Tax=Streptomyces sp. NBC_01622 TaxID=2975903 RepID=UPI00386E4AB7|nr:Tat pathway signal protein [Streptomyces sp. NBC_01622]
MAATAAGATAVLNYGGSQSAAASTGGTLTFPKDSYTTRTKTITTADGVEKNVTYRFWENIVYVADPVDPTYQCLNVQQPVEIDGRAVDASHAPVFFSIPLGGFLSGTPAGGTSPGGTSPGGGFPGSSPSPSDSSSADPSATPSASPTTRPPLPPGAGDQGDNSALALAAGYVVVTSGARGRDNVKDGKYYGKAPAALVDLKAALRYVHKNKGVLPGDPNKIITNGGSAGGNFSSMMGASVGSPVFDSYLRDLGAAEASDAVFASAVFCPIIDLGNADKAYEWMYGSAELNGELVDQTASKQLTAQFAEYQASLGLHGVGRFGRVTAANYDRYLLDNYVQPAATSHLRALSETDRTAYLTANPFIRWSGDTAAFSWDGYIAHIARSRPVPAFDDKALSEPEPGYFGDETHVSRHFTDFGLRYATGDKTARVDRDIPHKVRLTNPMTYLEQRNPRRAKHWWLRIGTSDTTHSLTAITNLALKTQNLGDDVNLKMYWDGGHGANEDPGDLIKWMGEITGYSIG